MRLQVDLNADLGEGSGRDDELLTLVSSANIATGFHAGDANSMRAAVLSARANNVSIGAHPSLFDRENFGRKELPVAPKEVFDAVLYQIGVFQAIAEANDAQLRHVKPHGALYNMAVRDKQLAGAIAQAIAETDARLILFAPARTELARAGQEHGLRVVCEAFADRNYLQNGWLVPRTRSDALLHNPDAAATRVVRMLRHGKVKSVVGPDVEVAAETICLHGDTPGAVQFARALRARLEREGAVICAPTMFAR